ncbi:MAG TPA: alkaline phosphatase family protein, partial [Baekduia sp.]
QHTAGGGCSSIVMDYFDGNTVTGLWNLAQHFTMSDQHYETTFGPSTPGALNLISGNTHGATPANAGGAPSGTDISDPDPLGDDCAAGSMAMSGINIGNRMNDAHMTWGWFQGGFRPTATSGDHATCGASHTNIGGAVVTDYSAHHEPFQYYASTANPHHRPPSSAAAIGTGDQANHQYDLTDFDTAVKNNNLPQVSFLKAAQFEDGHPGSSDPLDEQRFVARTLDELQQSPDWASTAVVITYDDSDGWYDHAYEAPINSSSANEDGLDSPGHCGAAAGAPSGGYQDRCGHGPRLPFLIVSPWVTPNSVSHTHIDQTSIIKFIESNWGLPAIGDSSFDAQATDLKLAGLFNFNLVDARAPVVYLDPATGKVVGSPPAGVTSSPSPPATTTTTTVVTPPPPATPTPVVTPPATTTPVVPPPGKPVVKKAPKPNFTFTTKKSGKKLTVKLKVTGLSASKGKITLSAKLTLGKASIATGKGTVKSGRLTLTLKGKKTLKRGTYKLTVTVTQAKKATKISKSFKLK